MSTLSDIGCVISEHISGTHYEVDYYVYRSSSIDRSTITGLIVSVLMIGAGACLSVNCMRAEGELSISKELSDQIRQEV